jgi:hypothetical protein
MPTARLIINAIEEADELAADLRNRGFAVEVVSPSEIPAHSVDLEIRVEECLTDQALRSAEELSKTEDIHVFIAPGAITESLRPIISVPLDANPERVEAPASELPSEVSVPDGNVAADLVFALSSGEDTFREDAIELAPSSETQPLVEEVVTRDEMVSSQALPGFEEPVDESAVYAMESQEASPASVESHADEVFLREPVTADEIPMFDNVPLAEEVFSREVDQPIATSESSLEPALASEFQEVFTPAPESQALPEEVFAREAEVTDEVANSDNPPLGEEIFALEADELAPAFEIVVEQPAAYALESQEAFPPSDWPIWQPLAQDVEPELATVSAAAAAVPAPSRKLVGSFTRSRADNRLFWRVAVVASVVAISTMLLGVSAHRISPIPRGLVAGDGGLPFQKSKTEASGQQNVADVLPEAAPASANPAFERVLARMPATDRPSPKEHFGRRVDRPKRVERAATRHEDDYVARDTVVRLSKKPEAPRMQAQKKSGIRYYSDLH